MDSAARIVVECQNSLKLWCPILDITLSIRNKPLKLTFVTNVMRGKSDHSKSFTKCKFCVKILGLATLNFVSKTVDARKSVTTKDLIIKFPARPCKNCIFFYNVFFCILSCSDKYLYSRLRLKNMYVFM
jgi:hypothetical protein